MAKPKKTWIQDAVKPENKGKFTAKAKAKGKTVSEYAKQVTSPTSKADTTTKREAVFAKNMQKIAKKG